MPSDQCVSPDVPVPVSFAACFAAWQRARRGKKPSGNQLAFEARWLDHLQDLHTTLRAGCWHSRRTVSFIVKHPKTREIHAPDFADRVVHHVLVERLEKMYEPIFIHDSFANRQGKGSHAAVDRLQSFMRQRENMPGCTGWALQLDVHNYFNSIHRPSLYAMLCARLAMQERRGLLPARHALALRSLCHKLLARRVPEHVRERVVQHCRSKLKVWYQQHAKKPLHPHHVAQLHALLGSYWGHFAHANTVRLRLQLFEQMPWLKTLFNLGADARLYLKAPARWQVARHRAVRQFLKPEGENL